MDDLDNMTGVDSFQGNRLALNTVSLNGDGEIIEKEPGQFVTKGGYFRKTMTANQKKGEKPEEIKLGESISVVMLKIRRSLSERTGDKVIRWTSEHSTADSVVELHHAGTDTIEIDTARKLREKYPGLRTIQIVYGLLLQGTHEPERVKIRIKGASLGSEAKDENTKTFYEYVSSFEKNEEGVKEHLRQYETILTPVKEVGKKTYFAIKFERGQKLAEDFQAVADQALREIHQKITATDSARAARIKAMNHGAEVAVDPDKQAKRAEANTGIEYPAEEINAEDIPF